MSVVKVAKLAGVSNATVSRVINNSAGVKAGTVERVMQAMAQIGYNPRPVSSRPGPRVARNNGFKIGAVAFLVGERPDFMANSPYMASVAHGIEETLAERGLSMIQLYSPTGKLPPIVLQQGIDGLIVVSGNGLKPESHSYLRHVPCVYCGTGSQSENETSDRVMGDNYRMAKLAYEYLASHHHKRMAFINPSDEHAAFAERGDAFCKFVESEMGRVDNADVVFRPKGAATSVDLLRDTANVEKILCRMVDEMKELPELPTGIFCSSDGVTALLYPILASRGIYPGKDVEVVSCNNELPYLVGLSPRPVTIDINANYIGRRAVEQLCWRMEHLDEQTSVFVKVKPSLLVPNSEE